jgi:predicted nucleotidyltransferase
LIEKHGKGVARLLPVKDATRPSIDPKVIGDFCRKHKIKILYLFGSVLTDRFHEESDVDVMFEALESSIDISEQMDMTEELEAIFGRRVDLVSKRAVEESINPIRKKSMIDGSQVIYAR